MSQSRDLENEQGCSYGERCVHPVIHNTRSYNTRKRIGGGGENSSSGTPPPIRFASEQETKELPLPWHSNSSDPSASVKIRSAKKGPSQPKPGSRVYMNRDLFEKIMQEPEFCDLPNYCSLSDPDLK